MDREFTSRSGAQQPPIRLGRVEADPSAEAITDLKRRARELFARPRWDALACWLLGDPLASGDEAACEGADWWWSHSIGGWRI